MTIARTSLFAALILLASYGVTRADPVERIRFVVSDPVARRSELNANVRVEDPTGRRLPLTMRAGDVLDVVGWRVVNEPVGAAVIAVPIGGTIEVPTQTAPGGQAQQPPIKDIFIKVTATRLTPHANPTSAGTVRTNSEISKFGNTASNDIKQATQGQAGVASDSAGQQHVRGEHAEIAYVVDGVPLPDSLSGRVGSIVVPATIQSLEILTGGYAPEFGGQTAAILDIHTIPNAKSASEDFTIQQGTYDTTNGNFTAIGPIGTRASYVIDLGGNRTTNFIEPQQPDDQTAHNTGSTESIFSKLRWNPSNRDQLTFTLSSSPDTFQVGNRAGLPSSFAPYGQGYGFLGLRDANGVEAAAANPNGFGSQSIALPSQQAEGMDITEREQTEFGTLSYRRELSSRDVGLVSITALHSGQEVHNFNPGVNVLNLPTDNSIEYNPTAVRNVHNTEILGSLMMTRGKHEFKTGLVLNSQTGDESYQIIPGSRLALDALAAASPILAPAGTLTSAVDVNGFPVYVPTSGVAPTVRVHRSGFYRAGYAQDTWRPTRRFSFNYGLRLDWYKQSENLDQPTVDAMDLSPRLNFSYLIDRITALRWSYNRLFNTPPVAQGATVGEAIQPETLDQYEVSLERAVAPNQSVKVAYYVKNIRNQVDTALLVPGSEIGLYSAVNFEDGGVHGIEFSYDLTPRRSVGWDSYVNYSYSIARPNGLATGGVLAPEYNDHDQRHTVGVGLAYTLKSGATGALVFNYGSGLASSTLTPTGTRIQRSQLDLKLSTSPKLVGHHIGFGLDVDNIFDERSVINFESGFSGTRFQTGRRVLLSISGTY